MKHLPAVLFTVGFILLITEAPTILGQFGLATAASLFLFAAQALQNKRNTSPDARKWA